MIIEKDQFSNAEIYSSISFGRFNSTLSSLLYSTAILKSQESFRKWYSTFVEDGAFRDPSVGCAAATLFAVERNKNGP